jgi:hypothetical protein
MHPKMNPKPKNKGEVMPDSEKTIKNIVILKNGVQMRLDLSEEDTIALNKAFVDQDVNPTPAVINVKDKGHIFEGESYVHIKISEISAIIEG